MLGIEQVGIHDDFLELGGNSLLATRIFAQLREEFRIELSVALLFDGPTVGDLARAIAEVRGEKSDDLPPRSLRDVSTGTVDGPREQASGSTGSEATAEGGGEVEGLHTFFDTPRTGAR